MKTNYFKITFYNIMELLKLVLKKHFKISLLTVIIPLSCCIVYVSKIYALQNFFDSLETIGFKISVFISLGVVLLLNVVEHIFELLKPFTTRAFMMRAQKEITGLIIDKCSKIDLLKFENTEFLNLLDKAVIGANSSLQILYIAVEFIAFYIPFFAFLAIYYCNINPMFFFCIVIAFVPVIINQFIRVKVYKNLENEVAPLRREADYYKECIVSKEYFKETRVLGCYKMFNKLYIDKIKDICKKNVRTSVVSNSILYAMKLITFLGYSGIIVMLVVSFFKGKISIGALAALYTTIDRMFKTMEDAVYNSFDNISQNLGSAAFYFEFINIDKDSEDDSKINFEKEIELRNVSFTYPKCQDEVIKNINIKIDKGSHIAIVGENGAGKSTLAKIIVGLYSANQGNVFLDGVDITNYNSHRLYRNVSAVFQKFCRYNMTIRNNVCISDFKKEVSDEKLLNILERGGFEYSEKKYNDGVDTMISRDFGGIDISGGQWQRLAISRGIYREHDIIVLDEPTASIDPIEEKNLYNKFSEVSRDKTLLLITHRLGSVKIADKILVMRDGEIVETGTFDELMDKQGYFYDMYRFQQQMYVNT